MEFSKVEFEAGHCFGDIVAPVDLVGGSAGAFAVVGDERWCGFCSAGLRKASGTAGATRFGWVEPAVHSGGGGDDVGEATSTSPLTEEVAATVQC